MKIKKYIKTKCGMNRYLELRKDYNKNIFTKIRLIFYVIVASLRDIFNKPS